MEITRTLNKLLTDVKGSPESSMIETLVIRTMQKAKYSTKKNIGHYGLGFKDYAHFTSPIRGYPDVIVHRLLATYLNEKSSLILGIRKHLHLSEREKKRKKQRESIKYMQCIYMSDHIGMVYKGIVTSIADFGIFVEIKKL
jgi:exoribonuclease R